MAGIKVQGFVRQGKFYAHNPMLFKSAFSQLEGQAVELVVRKQRKPRSGKQNSYMWGVVYKYISQYLGYDENEVHDLMRDLFLFFEDDYGLRVKKKTSALSTTQMEEYLEKVRMWAFEKIGCIIPLPNEVEI